MAGASVMGGYARGIAESLVLAFAEVRVGGIGLRNFLSTYFYIVFTNNHMFSRLSLYVEQQVVKV